MPQQSSGRPHPTASTAQGPARRRAALAGIAAAAAGLGVAELVAAVIAPRSSPLFAAGSLVIDVAPPWLKESVIAVVGTADKAVIVASVALLVAVLAAAAGLIEHSRPPWGQVLLGAVGVVGLVAATTRADSAMLSAIPSLLAIGVGVILLRVLTRQSAAVSADPGPTGVARRAFLITSGLAAGLGVLAVVAGRVAASGIQAVDAARRMFTLPTPAVAAPPVLPGASLAVPGITPLITANENFYRIDTALLVPSIDPANWSLTVTGMVDRGVTITFDELLALPLEESYTTLACVSNYVGGDLIGNAL